MIPEEWLDWREEDREKYALENAQLFVSICEEYINERDRSEQEYWESLGYWDDWGDLDDDEILDVSIGVVTTILESKRMRRRELDAVYPGKRAKNPLKFYQENEVMLRQAKNLWPIDMKAAARANASDDIKVQVVQAYIDSLFAGI